jgi:hypothetical protein
VEGDLLLQRLPQPSTTGRTIDGVASVAYDLQNTHMTVWCGYANAGKLLPYIDFESPKEYMNGVKYGSPSGLMQILR